MERFCKPTGSGEQPLLTVVAKEAMGNGCTKIVSKKLAVPQRLVTERETM